MNILSSKKLPYAYYITFYNFWKALKSQIIKPAFSIWQKNGLYIFCAAHFPILSVQNKRIIPAAVNYEVSSCVIITAYDNGIALRKPADSLCLFIAADCTGIYLFTLCFLVCMSDYHTAVKSELFKVYLVITASTSFPVTCFVIGIAFGNRMSVSNICIKTCRLQILPLSLCPIYCSQSLREELCQVLRC